MMFWADDLEVSKVKCTTRLMDNLKAKESALQSGWDELKRIADMIQKLPSYFHVIDIRTPDEDTASTQPEWLIDHARRAPGARDCTYVASCEEDKLYIAELEAKLKEKQADERAWAAHLQSLHQREKEVKNAFQQRLNSAVVENEELRHVVKTVAGKLFDHRERFWGLSTPARNLGEELISTLKQVGFACDDPFICG
jgi:predicted nuclease with TOPRIM domain